MPTVTKDGVSGRQKRSSSRTSSKKIRGLRLLKEIANLRSANHDQDAGVKIVMRALEEPLRQIVANTGDEPSVVLSKVLEGKGSFGWNAATGEYGDLVQMGVIDPTKVTRYALQNAASVVGLILTTDAMVAELPQGREARTHAARRRRYGLLIRRCATLDPAFGGVFSLSVPVARAARRVSDAGRRRWSWAAPHSRAAAAREILCR